MFCNNCGCEIQEGSKFCRNCGEPVVQEKNNSDDNLSLNLADESNVIISESINKSNDISILDKVKDCINTGVTRFKASPNKIEYSVIGGFIAVILLWIIIGLATSTSKITGKWENSEAGYVIFTEDGDFFVDNDNVHGTYSIKGTQLIMIEDGGGITTCNYNISDNILTMTTDDGNKMAFYKAE